MRVSQSRRPLPHRMLTGATLAAGVSLATALTGITPAQSSAPPGQAAPAAAPAAACPADHPVDELRRGQQVSGLTVATGETPEEFTGEVIGVLQDGIAPDVDMVMVRLTSPEIDRVGGIWSGMSGSPVYADDGRLIGAVAYGLSWGPSPVAGVTPAAEMRRLLDLPPAQGARLLRAAALRDRVEVPPRLTRRLQAHGLLAAERGAASLQPLPVPVGLSGLSTPARMRLAQRSLGLKNVKVYRAPSAPVAAAPGQELVAGGNLGVSVSFGDFSAVAIGTVTAVCGDEVLGFGHPFFYTGPASLSAHRADALYVQEDPTAPPFKLANPLGRVGTVDQDRRAGVRGLLGQLPPTTRLTSTVSAEGRTRTGTTYASVPDLLPDVAALHLLVDHDRVFDGFGKGSAAVSWTVDGRLADGTPFRLRRADRYADPFDILFWPSNDLYSQLASLVYNDIEKITVTSVRSQSTLTRLVRLFEIRGLAVRRGGVWVPAPRRQPVVVRPGATLRLRVALGSYRDLIGSRRVRLDVAIPRGLRAAQGSVDVVGGGDLAGAEFGGGGPGGFAGGPRGPDTIPELLQRLRRAPTRDQVIASLFLSGPRGKPVRHQVRTRTDAMVTGSVSLPVMVRGARR